MGPQRRVVPHTVLSVAVALLLAMLMPAAAAAQDGDDDNNRRDRFDIPDDATSENNRNLERILQRFPESDADADGILTAEEAREFIDNRTEEWEERRERERDRNRGRRSRGPTHRDVAYGDHERQVIDLYLAPTDEDNPGPKPLVVYFHGGQFVTGNKGNIQIGVRDLLARGVSVASVSYRLTREEPFPACFEDAARAVQFLRLNAEEYNLDPERFAGAGQDAGGNLALYLALHDDLATRPTRDEIERRADRDEFNDPYDEVGLTMQSTRLLGVVAQNPLASFDPRFWDQHGLPLNNHERYLPAWMGANYLRPFDDRELIRLVNDISPAELVSLNDPPMLLISSFEDLEINEDTSWTIMRLHPRQSLLLSEIMREHGGEAIVRYRNMPNDPGTNSTEFFEEVFNLD